MYQRSEHISTSRTLHFKDH